MILLKKTGIPLAIIEIVLIFAPKFIAIGMKKILVGFECGWFVFKQLFNK